MVLILSCSNRHGVESVLQACNKTQCVDALQKCVSLLAHMLGLCRRVISDVLLHLQQIVDLSVVKCAARLM